ncbi:DnaJ-like protein [Diplodia seriata]
MAYSPLSEEIEHLIIQRLLREDVPTRCRMVEAALDVYSRTSSVLALLHGQPVAFFHKSSGRACTLTGVRVELQACRLVPMPRVRTLDRKLEARGEAPPQHGGRGPPPTAYSRYESDRPSVSRRDSNPNSSSYYYSETRGPAGTSSSRSTFYTTNGGPASSSGYYPSGHDYSGSSSHYPHSHGPSRAYTDSHIHGHPNPSHFHAEYRMPGGPSCGYPSDHSYHPDSFHHHDHPTDPRRPAPSSSGYYTDTRAPGGSSSGGDPSYTEYTTYNTYTRAPRTASSPGHDSGYGSRSPSQAPPPPNATETEIMEHQLKTPYGYYQVMGVPRDATDADIRREYRRLAVAHHPDRHPEADRAEARRRFQAVSEANECLGSGVRRERYEKNGGRVPEGGWGV